MEDTHKAVQSSGITSPNCVSTLGGNDGIFTVKGAWEIPLFPSLFTRRLTITWGLPMVFVRNQNCFHAIVPASQDWSDTFSGFPSSFTTL